MQLVCTRFAADNTPFFGALECNFVCSEMRMMRAVDVAKFQPLSLGKPWPRKLETRLPAMESHSIGLPAFWSLLIPADYYESLTRIARVRSRTQYTLFNFSVGSPMYTTVRQISRSPRCSRYFGEPLHTTTTRF